MSKIPKFIASGIFLFNSTFAEPLPYGIKVKEVLAENNFSANNLSQAPWKIHFDKWIVENGELSVEAIAGQKHEPSMSLYAENIPNTCMFSCDFTLNAKGQGVRVAFFGKAGCKLMIQQHKMYFIVNDRHDDKAAVIIDWRKHNLELGQKHHVDFIVKDDSAIALINGKVALAGKDPMLKIHKERFQFGSAQKVHRLDNFKLTKITVGENAIPEDIFRKVPKIVSDPKLTKKVNE